MRRRYNFPVVRVRYEIVLDGIAGVGRLEIPADEWAAMDDAERDDLVRSAALAARASTRWCVEAPRRIDPSAN